MTKPLESSLIRKEIRDAMLQKKRLNDYLTALEMKLIIALREEDRETVYKTNGFEKFNNNVKGLPRDLRSKTENKMTLTPEMLRILRGED